MRKMDNQINITPAGIVIESLWQNLLDVDENLRTLIGAPVVFTRGLGDVKPLLGWPEAGGSQPTSFEPLCIRARIAAIDSSCRRIAETQEGTVYAVRGGLVEAEAGKITSFKRFGPLLIHLTREASQKMVDEAASSPSLCRLILLEPQIAESFIRHKIERFIQFKALEERVDILLIDGPLKMSKFEDRFSDLRTLIERATEVGSSVMGISKTTRLKVLTRFIAKMTLNCKCPAFLDVKDEMGVFAENLLGNPYIVKFSLYGDPFRIDVRSDQHASHILGILLANDIFYAGYPESLRLAHHLSVLKDADVASIEGFMLGKLNVEPQPVVNSRTPYLQNMPKRLRY